MTQTKSQRRLVSSIIPIIILFSITLAHATTEDNYKTDNNFLTDLSESTHIENGYRANIIINPCVTGIYETENGYQLDLTLNPNGIGGKHAENNYRLDLIPEITFPDIPDLAIIDIAPYKTIVGKGYACKINLTVSNQGLYYETFYFTVYANATTVEAQTITLTGKDYKTVTCTWDTTGLAYGNYTISAQVIVPCETFTGDNILQDGTVLVTITGDVNGDGIVDGADFSLMGGAYRSEPGDSNWNPNFDINGDGIVDGADFSIAGGNYRKTV